MFKLEIDTNNAAFEDNAYELEEILEKLAGTLRTGLLSGILLDSNGNLVGKFWRE